MLLRKERDDATGAERWVIMEHKGDLHPQIVIEDDRGQILTTYYMPEKAFLEVREGMKADIAIFNPDTVRDLATFERPHQYAEGVDYTIVNGQVAFEGGKMTAARPGRVLYGPSARR